MNATNSAQEPAHGHDTRHPTASRTEAHAKRRRQPRTKAARRRTEHAEQAALIAWAARQREAMPDLALL